MTAADAERLDAALAAQAHLLPALAGRMDRRILADALATELADEVPAVLLPTEPTARAVAHLTAAAAALREATAEAGCDDWNELGTLRMVLRSLAEVAAEDVPHILRRAGELLEHLVECGLTNSSGAFVSDDVRAVGDSLAEAREAARSLGGALDRANAATTTFRWPVSTR